MTAPSRAEKMQAIYDQVPPMADCKGNCWISCGPAGMTPWERKRLADAGHKVTPEEIARNCPGDFWCEALGPDGRCMAYDIRPLLCRMWGTVEWLPCPSGCLPAGGWLADETAFRLIAEANKLGGWGQPVGEEVFEALRDPAYVAAIARQLHAKRNDDSVRFQNHGTALPLAITRRVRPARDDDARRGSHAAGDTMRGA